MAKQTIDIGSSPNKGDGDPLRTAFTKINQNFDELYAGGFADPESVGSNLSPDTDATYNLGSADKQWADVHVSDFLYLNGQRIEALSSGALLVNGSGAREAADIVGSVFSDDSTLLIDGINSSINLDGTVKGNIIPDTDVAYDIGSATKRFRDLYLSGSTIDLGGTTLSIVGGELQLGGVKVPTTADVAATVAVAVSAPTGDLTGSVFADDSTLMVDAVNNKLYAETLTTLAVFGNPTLALNADVIALDAQSGNLTLQTTNRIINNFGSAWEVQGTAASMVLNDDGVLPSELSVNIDVVDFGTGNTVDLQGNSVLFDGASIQNFAPGNIYANSGQFLYVTGKHAGGTATNVAFTYDTDNNRPRQTFYGKTQFGFNGQAPIVDFDGATVTNLNAPYTPNNGTHWADPDPTTVGNALDRLAAAIYAVNGNTPI